MNRIFTISFIIFSLFFSSISKAQLSQNTYWIQFTDKNNSPYSLTDPEVYLSSRSIERRSDYNIELDSLDLPVNPWYLDSIVSKGAEVVHTSKWLNGAAINTNNDLVLQTIYELSFVDQTSSTSPMFSMNFMPYNRAPNIASIHLGNNIYDYGDAFNQIDLHNGQVLHNNGFQGQGMLIAVIDAGFKNIDEVPGFDSLFINNQIIGTWDFVSKDTNVYNDHSHGKSVLSTIATNLPNQMIGTAPKANFLLLRSENTYSETKLEEINWIAAAEYADSIGVDIITSSLGYDNYDSPSNSYIWGDLDGETAPITLATDIAAEKGIFMVTSAGNEGSSSWQKITSPADAKLALTVGACTNTGAYANFSSRGNTADGRIKPDIVAQGQSASLITSTDPSFGNGTSFSTPIIAGLVACLWQVDRTKSNLEILDLIKSSSHQYLEPDSILGYGIPNFQLAYDELNQGQSVRKFSNDQLLQVYPSVFNEQLNLKFFALDNNEINVEIFSINGDKQFTRSFPVDSNKINNININSLSHFPKGIYIIRLISKSDSFSRKIIKK